MECTLSICTDTYPYLQCRLLDAVCRLLSRYPTNITVFRDSCRAVIAINKSLPLEPTDALSTLQKNLLMAAAQFDLCRGNMSVIDYSLNLLIILWSRYPKRLPPECNMDHLSFLISTALDVEGHGEKAAALQVGQDFVSYLMRQLSEQQLLELEKGGTGRRLRQLLSYQEEMSPEVLQQVVVGVGMLAELELDVAVFVGDNIHVALLFAAQRLYSHAVLQELIWGLLTLVVQRDTGCIKELTVSGVLSVAASIVQEGFVPSPLIKFLTVCCHHAPNPFLVQLLESREVIVSFLTVVDADAGHPLEVVTHACDFLAYLCSKAPPRYSGVLVELGVVTKIEVCGRKWPEACLFPACLAIEGFCNPPAPGSLSMEAAKKRAEFFEGDHHIFTKDMLCDAKVSQSTALVELSYVLLQKLLRASPSSVLQRMGQREFVEALVMLFARDTFSLPQLAGRIVFTMHFFVVQMKEKECFEHLRDLCFHTFVVDLFQSSNSYDIVAASLGLLTSLLSRYHTHFKSVSVLLETQLPELLVEKCSQYRGQQSAQFGDDLGRILLNITADKEMSLQLHKRGYMEKLLGLLDGGYAPVVSRSIIHAVGNISLGGQSIKQELHERNFHETLLHTLEDETGDGYLLSACCRVLHILSSGDHAKRRLVERGCVSLLLQLMRTRQDDLKLQAELTWRSLGLLSSLGFMAVMNRRYVLTRRVVERISDLLRKSCNGKVISYTVLVFLGAGELDEGAVQLRQLQIEQCLEDAMQKPAYIAQAPDLIRWCNHVLEKQYLYTLLAPAHLSTSLPLLSSSVARQVDWPHHLMETEPMETGREGEQTVLLPQDDDFLTPQHPVAPELTHSAQQRLRELGLDPDQPLFRVGRVYGSTHGFCSNCDRESVSEELVIRPHSLTPQQYQDLIDNGWYRRGGVKLFRLRCNHNVYHADWETCVNALKFDRRSHKSYGRVLKRMPKERLTVETLPTHFNREAFDLYNAYHIEKHDKPLKSMFSYAEHIVNSPVRQQTVDGVECGTFHQLYRLDGKLVAIGIIDVVPKGIVSIYMWYNVSKAVSKYSFGVYSALKELELVCKYHERNPNMRYYYLQGWNRLNKKLAYKSNYGPGYFYCPTITREWVEGEKEVERNQEAYIQRKKEEKMKSEGAERESAAVNDGLDSEGGGSEGTHNSQNESGGTAAPTCNSHDNEKSQSDADTTDGEVAKTKPDKQTSNSVKEEGGGSTSDVAAPAYHCEAYPNDLAHYTARTGESTVNIRQLVVCLNYSEYHRLGDVINLYHLPETQVKILEQRLSELVVTLSPWLLSQLVIDLKVCIATTRLAPADSGRTANAQS